MAEIMRLTDEELDRQIGQAIETGKREPVAVAARFDPITHRIIVDLDSDVTFIFPVSRAEGLAEASEIDLASVEVSPGGMALHWESLDIDFSIAGLLAGFFGSKSWLSQLYSENGRKGGSCRSTAKSQAARQNGKFGGRPKKRASS